MKTVVPDQVLLRTERHEYNLSKESWVPDLVERETTRTTLLSFKTVIITEEVDDEY